MISPACLAAAADASPRFPARGCASLIHDAPYQFVPNGLPLTRRHADQCFLRLLQETGFRPRKLYYLAVRVFGWLVPRATRHVRKTVGTKVVLDPEVVQ